MPADDRRVHAMLREVTDALDDAIKCVLNGGSGWTQEDYGRWADARQRAEDLLREGSTER